MVMLIVIIISFLACLTLTVKSQKNLNGIWVVLDIPGSIVNAPEDTPDGTVTYNAAITATLNTQQACQTACTLGCDLAQFDTANNRCRHVLLEKSYLRTTYFKGQADGIPLYGQARDIYAFGNPFTDNLVACRATCTETPQCGWVTQTPNVDAEGVVVSYTCRLHTPQLSETTRISFRRNPEQMNNDVPEDGRVEFLGNTGNICTHAVLLHTNKISCQNRVEVYHRFNGENVRNSDNFIEGSPRIYGEIASVFDIATSESTPSQLGYNLFCHGMVPNQQGNLIIAGGDTNNENAIGEKDHATQATGLISTYGRLEMFTYNVVDDTWGFVPQNAAIKTRRWYNSLVRTSEEKFIIAGGSASAQDQTIIVPDLEIYTYGDAQTSARIDNNCLAQSVAMFYPHMMMIPGSGNFFMYCGNLWSIVNHVTGIEVETRLTPDPDYHQRTTHLIAAGVTMPMTMNPGGGITVAEYILFGGGEGCDNVQNCKPNDVQGIDGTGRANAAGYTRAVDTTIRINTMAAGEKTWIIDEPMPYGRLTSNAILHPNGKICLYNGWRYGITGGNILEGWIPSQGSAMDIFCYDPEAAVGARWKVYGFVEHRRHYHSVALLMPNGRVFIAGTDQAQGNDGWLEPDLRSYNHKAEVWTPPWDSTISGVVKPVITISPAVINFRQRFTLTFQDASIVTKIALMAPGANTHGTEFNQRLVFVYVVERSADGVTLTLDAPLDSTHMLTGHHMIFAVNGDTPSDAVWTQLANGEGELNVPTENPTTAPVDSPTVIPTEPLTVIPSATPNEPPSVVPSDMPTVSPTVAPTVVPTPLPGMPTLTPSTTTPSATPTGGTTTPSATPTEGTSIETPATSPVTDEGVSPSTSVAPTVTTDTQSQGSDELGTGVIAGIVVGALILLLAIIAAILFFTGVFRGKGEATNTTGAAPGPIEGSSRVSYRDAYGPDSPVMTPHDTTLVVGSSDINLEEGDPSVSFRDVDPLEPAATE